MSAAKQYRWERVCSLQDLVANSGVCTLLGAEQVALFYLPHEEPAVYALGNHDPIADANVLSRGILGDVNGVLTVTSPMYKQHFDLRTGACLENAEVRVPTYEVQLNQEQVLVARQ